MVILNRSSVSFLVIKTLLTLFVFNGCSSRSINESDSVAESVVEKTADDKKDKTTTIYLFSDNALKQEIRITYKEKNKIEFEYYVSNRGTGCKNTFNGTAVNKYPDADPELDEDKEGFGYPVLEYLYETDACSFAVRVAMLEKDKVQIRTINCSTSKECPINSAGILRIKH